MEFREATEADLKSVADHTISRGLKEYPETIDLVYALEHEGKILGVGGIKLLNPTTAWAWMDWSEYALQHIRTVYRVTCEWLDELMKRMKLRRVMAAVETDFEQAILTVEHLGFDRESTMWTFFGDKPAYLYVKFAEDGED